MAVQRVAPAGTTSPVQYGYRPALSQPPVPARQGEMTLAQEIENLPSDFQRAMFCREQAEAARRRWFAGRQREIEHLVDRAAARDPRFKNMTEAQLQVTARWRWSQSAQGQYLMGMESKFTAWAHMYLSFAEMEVLDHHGLPRR